MTSTRQPTAAPRARRTQEERRRATVRKVLDAAAAALVELGYARTTVQAICARAGVSQGGLFRHFPTLDALMVAVGDDVGERLLASYRRRFRARRGPGDPYELALRLVREHCRSRLNAAWFELAMAARTDARLRAALRPTAARYHASMETLGRELFPELAAALGPAFAVWLDTVVALFDGEVVHHAVLDHPSIAAARLEMLTALARSLAPPPAPSRPAGARGSPARAAGARGSLARAAGARGSPAR